MKELVAADALGVGDEVKHLLRVAPRGLPQISKDTTNYEWNPAPRRATLRHQEVVSIFRQAPDAPIACFAKRGERVPPARSPSETEKGDPCTVALTGATRMPNSSPDETSERKRRAALRRRLYVTGAAIAVGLAAVVFVLPSAAQEPPPPPIASEFLTARSVFTDDIRLMLKLRHHHGTTRVVNVPDPSRTVVGRFTLQPGAQFPWHTHAGPVVVNIVTGH